MRIRKLRIAWSIVCGIACVLLIVLWVRSYWYHEGVCYFRGAHDIGVESIRGQLLPFFLQDEGTSYRWYVFSGPDMGPDPRHLSFNEYPHALSFPIRSFAWYQSPYYLSVPIPHWLVAVLFAGLGSAPWIRARFGLRTLLIATTRAAMVSGLAVYVAKE